MGLFSLGKVRSAAMQTLSGATLPVAIDFGASGLKLLQLHSGAGAEPPQLVCAAMLETPDALLSDPAKRLLFQFQALPRLVKSAGFRGKRAVCAIPAGQTFIKHMQFPKGDAGLIDLVGAAIPVALGCPAESLVLRHYVVEGASAGGKQEVVCMAAARDFVERMMAAVRESRLECVGIHPECVATIKAFEHINRRAGDEQVATLYLDLAAGTTKVWIARGSALVFAKTIALGGHDLDTTVARAMDWDLATARMRRLAAGAPVSPAARPMSPAEASASRQADAQARAGSAGGDAGVAPAESAAGAVVADDRRAGRVAPGLTVPVSEQAAADVAPGEYDLDGVLEVLTDEVAMCLRYFESIFPGRRVDRAVFFGGEARHRGLCQLIARRVRLPAHVADPLARMNRAGGESVVGVDFSTPQPGWTVPFGLSLCPTDF
jgi:type IV pilus assembly protein PilM